MNEDQRRKLALLAKNDFEGYSRRFLKIKTKDGVVKPLDFNGPQKMILDAILDQQRKKQPVRIIILKSRQLGSSTFCQAWLAHKAFTHPGQNCLTIAQSLDMAGELFGKAEMMYNLLPEYLQPPKDSRTRGKRLALADPMNSLMYVETAENRDAGRSGTYQHVHVTEMPFWPDAKRTMDGLLQSVPNTHGTSVIMESTAAGMGDYFHDMWVGAVNGTNNFTPLFLPWYEMEEYQREPTKDDFPLDKRVRALQNEHFLGNERAVWYQDKLRDLNMDWDKLSQEYPTTPEVAFLTSGRPFFHPNTIKHYQDKVEDPQRKGIYRRANTPLGAVWQNDDQGDIWIWEEPQKDIRYVIGIDIATGRATDNSAMHVLKGTEQVASYLGRHEPDQLAELAAWLGYAYNTALLVPERNSVGIATIIPLVNIIQYPNIYQHIKRDTTQLSESEVYGWATTASSRPAMLEKLAGLARTGELTMKCARTLNEMRTFTFQDDIGKKAEANQGSRDDMVMSLAIALAATDLVGSGEVEMVRRRGRYSF